MSKRGGRTNRGGRRHILSSHEQDPLPDFSATGILSDVDMSQPTEQQPDTIGDIEQQSANGNKRAKSGITVGLGARKAMRASKSRLTVEFNFEAKRVICVNASSFMHECGYILRKNCSLQYKEWRHVPENVRAPLREKLLTLFDIDLEDKNVCKVIDSYMASSWRGYRGELHDYFKGIGGQQDVNKAKTTRPPNLDSQDDWEYLCDMWITPKYLEIAQKNVMARGKRVMSHRNGSRSTIRFHAELGNDLGSSVGQIETWRLTHWNEEKGWICADAAAKYEEMLKLRNENHVDLMSDKAIMEKVLGRNSVRLSGWGRDPVTCKTSSTNNSSRPTYNQLVDELRELKETVGVINKVLVENNIFPPSTSSMHSQGDTSNHSRSGQSQNEDGENNDEMDGIA